MCSSEKWKKMQVKHFHRTAKLHMVLFGKKHTNYYSKIYVNNYVLIYVLFYCVQRQGNYKSLELNNSIKGSATTHWRPYAIDSQARVTVWCANLLQEGPMPEASLVWWRIHARPCAAHWWPTTASSQRVQTSPSLSSTPHSWVCYWWLIRRWVLREGGGGAK